MAWWGYRACKLQLWIFFIAQSYRGCQRRSGSAEFYGEFSADTSLHNPHTSVFNCDGSLIKMAAISPAAQDRLFVFGLGLATFAVLGAMRQMLVHYRNTAAIPPSKNEPQYITQDVEDSLKLSTLDKLLDSTNYCIQETTAIIICERALHDGTTIDVLLWYITRPDHKLREKGIRALTMMMNSCEFTPPSAFILNAHIVQLQ